jgi:hypothetical protein
LHGDIEKDAKAAAFNKVIISEQAQQTSDMRFKRLRHPEINEM